MGVIWVGTRVRGRRVFVSELDTEWLADRPCVSVTVDTWAPAQLRLWGICRTIRRPDPASMSLPSYSCTRVPPVSVSGYVSGCVDPNVNVCSPLGRVLAIIIAHDE